MRKPIIGITGNERPNPDDEFAMMSYTAKGFVEGVRKVGGVPIILPIGDEDMAEEYVSMIDKLILTGGQNVRPEFYGETQTIESDDYLLARDIFELALIKEALKQEKPIFTVCRGTQLFNVAMGGTLHQDIEDHWQDTSAEYTTQRLATKPDNILRDIYGEISHINSFHHQSIKDLAPNLKVIAYDPKDEIIEAVTTTDGTAFLGVQWHPEFLFDNRPKELALFDYIVNHL
ncbi:gamma-glutamyl-gamma-aminobutyrate hydrolase family protein [Streptococcus pneumoniae]